jgi:hypothetical protein
MPHLAAGPSCLGQVPWPSHPDLLLQAPAEGAQHIQSCAAIHWSLLHTAAAAAATGGTVSAGAGARAAARLAVGAVPVPEPHC